ncbi:hypothetical protein LOK49_LG07G02183 [Camellia lanceoleosa]|uniref:Uncharacterized protein n=1 Tax=Camellia lanceoleosa TaxID=1840588 RepID=A0ACC0GZY3_9ERIC|nr:hypothetical protein LOK49_LG07G02183 [Camellia lanceoleosa]
MELSITQPDDWHLHLRDGDLFEAVSSHSAFHFGRGIVMPNLKPAIKTTAAAVAYRESILKALPANSDFIPLMTLYLTDTTTPEENKLAISVGATTNSQDGVTDFFGKCLPVLEEMVKHNMPLLVHGEVTDPEVDIFDRERVFIDTVLRPLIQKFPQLKVVMEHVTTADAVRFVESCSEGFEPRIKADWELGDHSGGCMRKIPLQCENIENDKFSLVPNTYFPENSELITIGNIDECELACLRNCSCSAYAYDSRCLIWGGGLFNLRQLSSDDKSGRDLHVRVVTSQLVGTESKAKAKRNTYLIVFRAICGFFYFFGSVLIKSLNYLMQHGSNSLAEEKKLLREIKQNEAKMDNIKLNNNNNNIGNHASQAPQIRYYLGTRKDIRDHIQLIRNELKRLWKEDQKHTTNIPHHKRELKAIESDISSLEKKLVDINREKYEACECLLQLKKKGDDMLL